MREINFLAERRKALSKQEVADKRLMRLSLVGCGLMFVIFGAMFGASFFLNREIDGVRAAQGAARTEIKNDHSTEQAFVIYAHKLTSLSQIYQDRQAKRDTIAYFDSVFGPGVFIKGLDFDQKNKLLFFQVQSIDAFHLKEIFFQVNSPDVQKKFLSLNPSNLLRTPDGAYQVSLAVSTQKK